MSTIPQVRSHVNPRFLILPFDDGTIGFTILARRRADHYRIERIEGCDDVAYQLWKMDVALDGTDKEADGYAVNLTTRTCDCKGWQRWRHCKHLTCTSAGWEEGVLP